jgi:two-component system sensor histidine kinase BaeS
MLPLFNDRSVDLKSGVSEDPAPVVADADRVVQVLTNLLSNDLRHTPAGGRVTVEVETVGEATFKVADTGVGIAPEHRPRVFERFYRVEKSRSRDDGGSEAGLAISKALVEAMGGRIWAESPGHGRGATFMFTLPISRP